MEIKSSQQDVRSIFLRGSVGQVVSGCIWLVSAILGTWASERDAIVVLVLAGMFIFPLTRLALRLLGRPAGLPKGHPLNQLAVQVAFIVPLNLPVIGAATLYNINWFYPAFMLIIGTHYMPFIFFVRYVGVWNIICTADRWWRDDWYVAAAYIHNRRMVYQCGPVTIWAVGATHSATF